MALAEMSSTLVTSDAALAGAEAGLDFLVRHQVTNGNSADMGRFPYVYDTADGTIKWYSTNWTTCVALEAFLSGHKQFGKDSYKLALNKAARYLMSLQNFSPLSPKLAGVFREVTPQSGMAHVRDSLTAAWALLDYADYTGDASARRAAELFGQWFVETGMLEGYPRCTIRFDDQPWEPHWHGSFHSGSAFFMYRLFTATGRPEYREAMRQILAHYNRRHLDATGHVTVLVDAANDETLDNKANDHKYSPRGWQIMHQYNDDFGALANLAAYKLEGDTQYRDAAVRFLEKMLREQRTDGGFGPAEYSCPPAGGAVLLELLAAKRVGVEIGTPQQLSEAARYILGMQVRSQGHVNDGCFFGYTEPNYTVDRRIANLRTGAYSIMGLLRYAGAMDGFYFFE